MYSARPSNDGVTADRLDHGRRDEGRGNRHDPFDIDHHTAVVTDTDELTGNALENATRNTDFLPFHQMQLGRTDVENGFIVIAAHQNEAMHPVVGNDNRTAMFTVHDETYGHGGFKFILQHVYPVAGGVDENQVVDGGNQLAYALTPLQEHFVPHRNEVLHFLPVQNSLQNQLTAVGDANGKPLGVGFRGRTLKTGVTRYFGYGIF